MDFSGFLKSNPQLMGQALGAMGGGGQREQGPPPPRDAQPGIEGVRQQQDTGDQGYDGVKNVAKTLASFWAGGPAAGAVAQNAVGVAAGGNSGPAASQPAPGGEYSQTAQQAQGADWMKRWAGGFSG